MSVRFRKIAEARVDPERVTVRLFATPQGPTGRVSTLAYGESGGLEMMSTEGADPPVETALHIARELAAFKEEDVDVVDESGLWQPAWGVLE